MPIAQCVQVLKRQCHVIKSVQAMYSEAVSVLIIKYLFIPVICVVVCLPQWLFVRHPFGDLHLLFVQESEDSKGFLCDYRLLLILIKNWTSFKNFAPKLNLNHNIRVLNYREERYFSLKGDYSSKFSYCDSRFWNPDYFRWSWDLFANVESILMQISRRVFSS